LELDHELAYSSIAEVETSPLDILSIPCNKFGKSTDDGFEIECKKFLSNVWTISTEDKNRSGLPALWLNHSLLFDCPLVKTSILFLSSVLIVQILDRNFLHSISKPSSVLFTNLLQEIERMSRGLVFDIRNANRASLPPIVNIVDLAKFRPHDLPTLQPLITLTETCLELDHELAYSSIAEVETSPLDILSISCNKFGFYLLSIMFSSFVLFIKIVKMAL
jgi:hypothetical protein